MSKLIFNIVDDNVKKIHRVLSAYLDLKMVNVPKKKKKLVKFSMTYVVRFWTYMVLSYVSFNLGKKQF